jgi:hypothetical protein
MSLDFVPVWPVNKPGETLTKQAAERLARKIRHHWAILGYKVKTWIEQVKLPKADGTGENATGFYGVRSDLIGGKPIARIRDEEVGSYVTSEVEVYE